jgi:hypothetical protein
MVWTKAAMVFLAVGRPDIEMGDTYRAKAG